MTKCCVDGCDKEARGKKFIGIGKYCEMHRTRLLRHGDVGCAGRIYPINQTCKVDGCDKKYYSFGYCQTHLVRFRKYGEPGNTEPRKRPNGLILDRKFCTCCKKEYPNTSEYYYVDNYKKDGHSSICKNCHNLEGRETTKKLRLMVMNHYCNGEIKCSCCGESRYEFLTLDHLNGDGSEHRKIVKGSMYRWIIKNNYPPTFQILCQNCNFSKGIYGYCPHEKEKL